ncbi:MAG: cadmium-translocating P-type ATPase [Microbacterium sp.]|nr:cadmium-translocating P-type ATPase [Microbacterium sp.]
MTISATGAVILGYVEEAAALAFLYSIAEALEDKAMDRARAGLRALLKLVPDTALVKRGDATAEVEAKELRVGDVLVVRPGERIATDGIVRAGRSSLDTSAITGESIPVEVEPGTDVSAGSINTTGVLEVEATAAGTDNSLTTIVELVEQAQAEKGDRARLADRIARPLVPGVMILAVLVGVLGSLLSGNPELWITRALVVLVAASPCALAIAVPVTVVSAIGAASKFGVVVKSGAAFERFGGIRHLAVDKTGTLTRNEPTVTRVVTTGATETEVLAWAASVEGHSTHPLAAAITNAVPDAQDAADVTETAGHGIVGTLDGARLAVGSPRWLDAGTLAVDVEAMESEGMTVVIVHRNDQPAGAIGVRDALRPEVPEVIATLNRRGIGVTMLTGDNARTAAALAAQAGISDVRAELRPEDKATAVAELSKSQPTAMIGDGINDAPALAAADLGIAMGAKGADAAIESADVAFTGHDLRLIPQALAHARRGRSIINQNVVLSIAIIAVLLPLAITGILGLAAVVLVHEVAEVIVILNGLRAARRTKA